MTTATSSKERFDAMWNELRSQQDVDRFLELVNAFHDSCIKELKYRSGAYVEKNLSMWPINSERTLTVIIQRQSPAPSAIELEFRGLKRLQLAPCDENYTCEILDATMFLKEDCIFWCDCGGLSDADLAAYPGTAICAAQARWRAVDAYLGPDEVYIHAPDPK